jgi:hypothetical protein
VLLRQVGKELADCRTVNLDAFLFIGKRPQRGWNENPVRHRVLISSLQPSNQIRVIRVRFLIRAIRV